MEAIKTVLLPAGRGRVGIKAAPMYSYFCASLLCCCCRATPGIFFNF
jgi:hypothetical protein